MPEGPSVVILKEEVKQFTGKRIISVIREARNYSFEFFEWKKKFELKKHWLAHRKSICLRCDVPLIKKHTGIKNRRSFFCTNCQRLYT